jgi:hypothetical protein
MIIHVTSAKHIDAGQFELAFSDGRRGLVDLAGALNGPVFEPLRDPEFMARGVLDRETRTLSWPNGADVAPEFLYFLAFSADPSRFTKMLRRMFDADGEGVHDHLTDFTTPVSGAFYFAPSLDALDGILPSD